MKREKLIKEFKAVVKGEAVIKPVNHRGSLEVQLSEARAKGDEALASMISQQLSYLEEPEATRFRL